MSTMTLVSTASDGTQGNGSSRNSSVSTDGRYVAFESGASNLVAGDTNNATDIFIKDLQTGTISRASTASDGTQGDNGPQGFNGSFSASISADGRYVAFFSNATNFVAGDTNQQCDIFVKDLQTGTTTRVSTASDGTQGNDDSYFPSISDDGRYVAFESYSSNFVPGDTNYALHIFVKDLQTGTTTRVSTASDGTQGNGGHVGWYRFPSISDDGRYVAFESGASNLVTGDTNYRSDVFVKDMQIGATTRVSIALDGTQGNDGSYWPSISADGGYVVFESWATNLVAGDTNNQSDVFRVSWFSPDLDVDSDNSDGFDPNFARTNQEDRIEDDPSVPGKLILVNDNDDDGDGIPDFADGVDLFETIGTADEQFVPLKLELPAGLNPASVRLKFNYSGSDPGAVTRTGDPGSGQPYAYELPSDGNLRLWKSNGDLLRQVAPLPLPSEVGGGDWIKPGQEFDGSALDWTGQTTTIWAEAVKPSATLGGKRIELQLDPDGPGPLPYFLADAVRLTSMGTRFVGVTEDPASGQTTLTDVDNVEVSTPSPVFSNVSIAVVPLTLGTDTTQQQILADLTISGDLDDAQLRRWADERGRK